MINNLNRISIIGGSGTGKTTLADNIGKELNLPVCHLDGINYHKNWVERDKKERDSIIMKKINENKWIIEGTYRSTLTPRLERSDLIIYLDYSTFAQVKGVLMRFFKSHKHEKKEIPGCNEQMSFKFLMFVIKWRKNKRHEVMEKINNIEDKSKIIIFKNRKLLNKWYKKEFNKKINSV